MPYKLDYCISKIMSCRVQTFILTSMKRGRVYLSTSLYRVREMGFVIAWQLLAKCVWQPLSLHVVEGEVAASFHGQALVNYT